MVVETFRYSDSLFDSERSILHMMVWIVNLGYGWVWDLHRQTKAATTRTIRLGVALSIHPIPLYFSNAQEHVKGECPLVKQWPPWSIRLLVFFFARCGPLEVEGWEDRTVRELKFGSAYWRELRIRRWPWNPIFRIWQTLTSIYFNYGYTYYGWPLTLLFSLQDKGM
jgi:hypothetical protein